MKKIALAVASIIITGAAQASNPWLEDNGDRYAGISDSASIPTAVQPGIGDGYGGNIFEQTQFLGENMSGTKVVQGSGDSYGSPIPNVLSGDLTW